MSHFTVTVELPAGTPVGLYNHVLGVQLEPFNEDTAVEPYRRYEEGSPDQLWSIDTLQKCDYFGNTPLEQLTWQHVAAAYNDHWDHSVGDDSHICIDEDGRAYTVTTANPAGKWDWWCVGGRWRGYFLAKHDAPDDRVLLSPRKWMNENVELNARACDGGPLRHLDLEGARNLAGDEARARIQLYERTIAGLPTIEPWSEVLDRIGVPNIADARRIYGEQPGVQALRAVNEFAWHCPIEEFQWGETLYVERAMADAVPGFAHLTLDGEWLARGEMGWFAMSSDTVESTDSYVTLVNARLDTLDPDTALVVVDCHV